MADNQEPEPILLHEDTHQKDLISILGTQGLMYNDYNAAEYKLLMLIIKHNQTVIKKFIVPANLMHGHLPFTKEQFQAGHVDVVMPLKEFGYNRSNNLWLKDKLCQMAKKSIDIPYKMNDTTYHKHFDSLFTPDFYKSSNGLWMVNLRFDYALMQYFFAFDKGVTAIDLSLHMRTDYVGELHDWFLHKDYFIAQQILHHKPMNKAAYIVGGLRGFFHDKETSRGNHF